MIAKKRSFGLLLVLAMSLTAMWMTAAIPAGAQESGIPDVDLNPEGISPSSQCGKCHQDIYKHWKASLHAKSANNAVFQAAFMQVYFHRGEATRKRCLTCHAPVALINDDLKLEESLSHEGVNCDVCHSISRVVTEYTGGFNYLFDFGLTKQGPSANPSSPAHQTKQNPLYQSSEYCRECHELVEDGFKLIETYSEWKAGPYAQEGTDCQDCHMEPIPGAKVPPHIKQLDQKKVSNHAFTGGHSLTRRREAVEVKIENVRTFRNKVEVDVVIANKGAGHKIPTGLPLKQVILEVSVIPAGGGTAEIQRRIYQKTVADAEGRVITQTADLWLAEGLRVLNDNRLAPREARREAFMFFVEEPKNSRITARAVYHYAPEILQPAPVDIQLDATQYQIR